IGSVGKPKDGDPRACYVLLEIDEDGLNDVQFRRVAYDVEASAAAVEASVLPQAFADALRTAR
ncbi:MAG TPA: YfcE family phosphodiesterase, partial [Chitinophagales bacterium]|nr:YfcE family phosphodiesterase [Chitinophagales bacterium]